jgi:hypothetical protein
MQRYYYYLIHLSHITEKNVGDGTRLEALFMHNRHVAV